MSDNSDKFMRGLVEREHMLRECAPASSRVPETSWNGRRADRKGGGALPARDIIFHVQNTKVSASSSPAFRPSSSSLRLAEAIRENYRRR